MKRLFTTIMATAALSVAAFADNYSLYLEPTEGAISEWTVASLSKLTFSNGNIVLTAKDGTASTMPISGVKRMFFSTPEIQGIENIGTGNNGAWDGNCLHTDAQTGVVATIYSATGTLVAKQTVENNGSVNLSTLDRGMYIVHINGNSYKIFKP